MHTSLTVSHAAVWVAVRARALNTYAEMVRAIVPQLKPQRAAAAARAPLASICERERARNHVLTYIEPASHEADKPARCSFAGSSGFDRLDAQVHGVMLLLLLLLLRLRP